MLYLTSFKVDNFLHCIVNYSCDWAESQFYFLIQGLPFCIGTLSLSSIKDLVFVRCFFVDLALWAFIIFMFSVALPVYVVTSYSLISFKWIVYFLSLIWKDELLGLAEQPHGDPIYRNSSMDMDVLYRTGETQQVDLLISYSWKVHLLIVVVCLFRNYVDSIFLFGLMFYTVDGYCQAKESIIPSMFHRFFIMTKIPVSGT